MDQAALGMEPPPPSLAPGGRRPRCLAASLLDLIYARPMRQLMEHQSIKTQALVQVSVHTLDRHVERSYEHAYETQAEHTLARCGPPPQRNSAGPNAQPSPETASRQRDRRRTGSNHPLEEELEWRTFPQFPRLFVHWHALTTVWMCYVLLRYAALNVFGEQLEALLHLNLFYPLHCLLVGRFVLQEDYAEHTALLFACLHLSWRAGVWLAGRPYKFSLVHFMLLSERDLALLYARLSGPVPGERSHFQLTLQEADSLRPRERFVLDTMCFRLERPTKVLYILRPNRSPGSYRRLRQTLAIFTYFSVLYISNVTFWLTLQQVVEISLDGHYLRVYPACDARLRRLWETGRLARWSATPTLHHTLSGLADLAESFILWVEGGLACSFGLSFVCLLNYDLILYWRHIDATIRRLQLAAARAPASQRLSILRPGPVSDLSEATLQLQTELIDFMGQVRLADLFISDVLDVALVGWLCAAAGYTYVTKLESLDLPVGVVVLLAFIVLIITNICFSFLTLHRLCLRSYTALCSLMAHDKTGSGHTFGLILDLYARKRTCYTLFQQYPFQPSTFLTIIGYSFSCFFLVVSLFET